MKGQAIEEHVQLITPASLPVNVTQHREIRGIGKTTEIVS